MSRLEEAGQGGGGRGGGLCRAARASTLHSVTRATHVAGRPFIAYSGEKHN